jgi:hypothetical protein
MRRRRDFAIVVAIIAGLLIGRFLRFTELGLLLGLGIGLLVASLVANRGRK